MPVFQQILGFCLYLLGFYQYFLRERRTGHRFQQFWGGAPYVFLEKLGKPQALFSR